MARCAATRVQAAIRGHAGRRRAAEVAAEAATAVAEAEAAAAARVAAASAIQAFSRGRSERRELDELAALLEWEARRK